jgi:hypothetical protein
MQLTQKNGLLLFIMAVAALCTVELWVVTSPSFPPNSAIFGFVITADLLLGIPLLFYGLVVRPSRLPPITIAPIFLLAVVIAGYILPPAGRSYLNMLILLVPLVELALLCVVVWKVRGIYQHYRHARHQRIYFIDALETSVHSTFGKNLAIRLLTIEFSLIFLACFGFFMKFSLINPQHKVFTYHRKSRYPMIFVVFLLLIVLETIGLHLLIQHWSPLVAWSLTGLSIYSIFWMVGDFNAIRLHPIVLAGQALHLRSGSRWSATVPLSDIVDVQRPKRNDAKSRDYLSFARAGEAQIVLVLKQPVRVSGLFGIAKDVSRIGLFLDDVRAFRSELDQLRQASRSQIF